MSFALCHAMFGLCDLLWFYHKLNSPIVWFDSLTDFLYCLFSYICMHFNQSQIQPTPLAPFPRKGSVLIRGAISFTSVWLGSWTGTILLSEADSSEKTSPNHICSGFGWQILEFDPEGPAFPIKTIIHPMILLCVQQSII